MPYFERSSKWVMSHEKYCTVVAHLNGSSTCLPLQLQCFRHSPLYSLLTYRYIACAVRTAVAQLCRLYSAAILLVLVSWLAAPLSGHLWGYLSHLIVTARLVRRNPLPFTVHLCWLLFAGSFVLCAVCCVLHETMALRFKIRNTTEPCS